MKLDYSRQNTKNPSVHCLKKQNTGIDSIKTRQFVRDASFEKWIPYVRMRGMRDRQRRGFAKDWRSDVTGLESGMRIEFDQQRRKHAGCCLSSS